MSPAIGCPIYRYIVLLPPFFNQGYIYSDIPGYPTVIFYPYILHKNVHPLLRDEGRGCGDVSVYTVI